MKHKGSLRMSAQPANDNLSLQFRRAAERDFPTLCAIHDEAFGNIAGADMGPYHDYIKKVIEGSPQHSLFVAVNDDDKVLGFAVAHQIFNKASNLDIIVVDKEHRGQKIGKQLLAHIEDDCREKGVADLYLQVRACESLTIAFYKAKEYRHIGTQAALYTDGVDGLHMKKKLGHKEGSSFMNRLLKKLRF